MGAQSTCSSPGEQEGGAAQTRATAEAHRAGEEDEEMVLVLCTMRGLVSSVAEETPAHKRTLTVEF